MNPDVDAQTHPYISTGLKDVRYRYCDAVRIYEKAAGFGLDVKGVDCHIGSQLTEIDLPDAHDRVLALVDELSGRGITIEHLDLGGLGVRYQMIATPVSTLPR